ncbi:MULTISPECIES: efflux RND transporter periplasmic adaptor subunit [Sphingobacterium]|uniref:efflux RND transporter periplasmic adaptor subunit n=1 Tax=Sphingobacterium TaxID=28453 RepID=UPI0008A10FED|nr:MULTISPECIES: efflux RND transporter periplasmic adaptor subunit [Sphingobacterium]OFV15279.1 efflux transporter periplasmic adaptor subunit [Sphingobacterium sp. HMSC13C05]HAU55164.1 efflux RND transporter periplasmic adaptor subunit [Sphingobacterium sp.]HCX57308.1 efflux RND transporter periplasmic adaptor subunit [Sphingobacterium sp.]
MKTNLSPSLKRIYVPTLNSVKRINIVKTAYVLSAIFLYSCSTGTSKPIDPQPVNLPVVTIENGNETVYQEYPATIEASANIEIRPQVEGILENIYVDEGAKVNKGQALFKINDRPYQEQLNQAKANLLAAKASLENAELEVEKKTKLVNTKVLTDFQLKTAISARNAARANVQLALSAVETAKINVGYTLIRASAEGYIGRLQRKQGSLVGPTDSQPLTALSNVRDLHVYFSLGENDFIAFKNNTEGSNLQQKLHNLPPISLVLSDQTIYDQKGKIDMVDGQFDKNTGAITLRATFNNPEGVLRNGNTGRVRLQKKYAQALLVPQLATLEMQDKIFVYTVGKENKVVQQPITVIGKSGANYLVSKGLNAGDRIVYKGIDLLQDGQKITPQALSRDSINSL